MASSSTGIGCNCVAMYQRLHLVKNVAHQVGVTECLGPDVTEVRWERSHHVTLTEHDTATTLTALML